ncbi:MAG: redoxin domain-containing protein [Chitinophagaceae bacterium]|nr:redoxin domain-containing protein [Chitinophagaceae bacterium]
MNSVLRYRTFSIAMLLGVLLVSICRAQQAGSTFYQGQFAPAFSIKDIDGKFHSLEQYEGQKVILSFYRSAADPISNYRFHELEAQQDYFRQKGIVLLAVYESLPENVKLLRDTSQYYQVMIADPEGQLYRLYHIEESRGKLKGKLHGANQKTKEGRALMKREIPEDNKSAHNTAEFIIDEHGNIIEAHYAKYPGDYIPVLSLRELSR